MKMLLEAKNITMNIRNNAIKNPENTKKIIKNNKEIYKNKSSKDGLKSHCKDCHNIYYWKHRDENVARSKKYYNEHKEQCNKNSREYYQNNKDHLLEISKEYLFFQPEI